MKVIYTGKLDGLMPAQQRKLQAKFAKVGKLLDGREEREAHVILTAQRRMQRAEITLNYYDHPLVGVESAPDAFTAITRALDKLEKQALKLRAKWRDTKRDPRLALKSALTSETAESAAEPEEAEAPGESRVYRVDQRTDHKPLTLEEALLEMEADRDYLVYRDAETDRLSVLVRRRDGHFDLVQA